MKANEDKLDPELRRWIQEKNAGERTVIVRIGFSHSADSAAEALAKEGMVVQSSGPGAIIATSDREGVKQASGMSWVVRIELPQRLDMKSRLRAP